MCTPLQTLTVCVRHHKLIPGFTVCVRQCVYAITNSTPSQTLNWFYTVCVCHHKLLPSFTMCVRHHKLLQCVYAITNSYLVLQCVYAITNSSYWNFPSLFWSNLEKSMSTIHVLIWVRGVTYPNQNNIRIIFFYNIIYSWYFYLQVFITRHHI